MSVSIMMTMIMTMTIIMMIG